MVREITIHPVYNGFIVTCGCQKFVFSSVGEMVNHITKYYKNPNDYEKEFLKDNKVNDTIIPPPPQERTIIISSEGNVGL